MNHLFKCIVIWHVTFLGPGDSGFVQMKSLGSQMATP